MTTIVRTVASAQPVASRAGERLVGGAGADQCVAGGSTATMCTSMSPAPSMIAALVDLMSSRCAKP